MSSSYLSSPRTTSSSKMNSLTQPNMIGGGVEQYVRKIAMVLKQQIVDTNAALDEKFTAKFAAQQEEIRHASKLISDNNRNMLERVAAADTRLTDAVHKLDSTVQAHHVEFTATTTSITNELAVETDTLKKIMQVEQANVDQRCSEVEATQLATAKRLDSRISECVDALDNHIDKLKADLDNQMLKQHSHFTKTCSALENTVCELRDTTESKLAGLSYEQTERSNEITSQVSAHYEHFTDVCYNLDRKLAAEDARQDELIDENNKMGIDFCNRIANQFAEETAGIRQAVVEKHAELLLLHNELSGTVKREHTHFTDTCGKLDKKVAEKHEEQLMLLDQHKAHFTQLHTELEQLHRDENHAQDMRIQEQRTHFTDVCSALDVNMTSLCNELDSKYSTVCAKLDTKFTDLNTSQTQRTEEQYNHFTDITATLDKKMDERTWQMEKQNRTIQNALEAQLFEQAAHIDEKLHAQKAQFTEANDRLATTITAVATKIDEKFTRQCDSLDSRVEDLRKHTDTTAAQISKQFTTELTDLDQRMTAEHKQFSEVCVSLDRRITEDIGELDETTRRERKVLERKFDFQCDSLSKANASTHQHFTSACGSLAERIADASSALDTKMIAKLTDLSESISEQFATVGRQMDDDKAVFTSVCTKLDAKLAENQAALDDKLTSSCGEILTKLSQTNDDVMYVQTELTRNTEDLRASLASAKQEQDDNIAQACDRLERVLAAGLKDLGSQLDDVKASAAALKNQVEIDVATSINDLNLKVSARVNDLETHVNTTVESNIKSITTKMEVMETRVKTEVDPQLTQASHDAKRSLEFSAGLKDRLDLQLQEINENVTEKLEEIEGRIEDMTSSMDVTGMLSYLANEAGSA